MSQPSPSGKRILSIDGGGFRGLGCLLVIQAITDEAHRLCRDPGSPPLRPCEIFDLIFGTSTGGLIAVLLGHLGLNCAQAIQEYKELTQKLFGIDKNAFLDILTTKSAVLDSGPYQKALQDIVAKYAKRDDAPFFVSGGSASTQTGVIIRKLRAATVTTIYSWKNAAPSDYDWRVWEVARSTTAAPNYVSPHNIQNNKGRSEDFEDAAYQGLVNPTAHAIDEAKDLWKPESPGAIVSVGQGFTEIASKDVKPDRPATEKQAKPFVQSLLSDFKPAPNNVAIAVVRDVLVQAAKIIDVDSKVQSNDGYFRVDPPLKMGWELVDYFLPDVETNFNAWLASTDGKQLVETIAKKLVIQKPAKPPPPEEMIPPPAPPGTLKPNPACEKPRPNQMDDYLHILDPASRLILANSTFNVIFIIDDSTSMVVDPRTGLPNSRWDEARAALQPIADYALEIKANTIDMCFLNSQLIYRGLKDTGSIMNAYDRARPPHWTVRIQRTPTAACLNKVLNECIGQLEAAAGNPSAYQQIKPFDIILLTDGLPDDDPRSVLERAWARLQAGKHHPNYINVQVVQVGNDSDATARLQYIMSGNIGSIAHTVPYNGKPLTTETLKGVFLGGIPPNVRALLGK